MSLFNGLITSRVKLLTSLFITLLCASAAPVLYGFTKADIKPMKEALNTVQTTAMGSIDPIVTQAKTSTESTLNNIKSSGEVIRTTSVSNYDTASTMYQMMETHKDLVDKYNYYLFQYGEWIKAGLRYVPTVVADSFSESREIIEHESLGYKKWASLIGSDKMGGAYASVMEALKTNNNALKALGEVTGDDVGQVLGVIKQTSRNRMSTLLESIQKNAETIKKDTTDTYCANKVLMHLFVGKDSISQDNIQKLSEKVESLKDSLKTILDKMPNPVTGSDELISGLKKKLGKLAGKANDWQQFKCD